MADINFDPLVQIKARFESFWNVHNKLQGIKMQNQFAEAIREERQRKAREWRIYQKSKRSRTSDITDAQILRAARRTAYLDNFYTEQYFRTGSRHENYLKHVQMTTLDRLVARTKKPYKVCLRAVEKAAKRGIIDYGTTITRYWEVKRD